MTAESRALNGTSISPRLGDKKRGQKVHEGAEGRTEMLQNTVFQVCNSHHMP